MTPTARSLAKLRADGYLAEVVERWNPHARIRQDLFGLVDLIAVKPSERLLIQCTSRSNLSSRVFKVRNSEHLATLLQAGFRVQCWGWGRMASGRVECRIVDMAEHLETNSTGNENPHEK